MDTIKELTTNNKVCLTSESQQEIWLSCVIGGEDANRAFNESLTLELRGFLDLLSLKKSISDTIQRHEILRAVFSDDGHTYEIKNHIEPFEYLDLQAFEELKRDKILKELINEEMMRNFDLVNGPLYQITLIQTSHDELYVVFTAHHIVCDGWSSGVFLRDVSRLYNAYFQGVNLQMPSPPSYSIYSKEESDYLHSAEFARNLDFWKKEIGSDPISLSLPTDFERSENRTYNGRRIDTIIEPVLAAKLKVYAKSKGVSFFNLMLSCFELLMAKVSNQRQFLIGLPSAGQVTTEQYDLMGHCVNLLPLPVQVDLKLSFADYLKERRRKLNEALDYQRITFGTLLKQMRIARKPNEIPVVPIVFNVDLGMDDQIHFYGLDYSIRTNPRNFENFELFLNLFETKEKLALEWSYNPDLYTADTVLNWSEGLIGLLNQVLDMDTCSIHQLIMQDKDRVTLPSSMEASQVEDFVPVVQMVENAVDRFSSKVAVIFKDKPLTYYQLNSISNRLARQLKSIGVQKGDRIGVVMERSEKMIIAIFAILKAGAAYLPIDTDYPISRIDFTLNDAEAKFALIDKRNQEKFKDLTQTIIYDDAAAQSLGFGDGNVEVELTQNDPAYIIYTSGSTGNPKGVILDHGNLHSFLMNVSETPGIVSEDVFLAVTSNSFDISILELFLPYVHGAQTFLLDNYERRDPEVMLDIIHRHQITVMFATPSHWKMMLGKGWEKNFSSLKAISGGEPLEIHVADRLLDRVGSLWNIYGPTETTVFSTIKKITTKGEAISIGKPIKGTNIYIVDDFGNIVPEGEVGELYISGQGVGQGYINRDDLNAQKFSSDPFKQNANLRLFKTGDLGKYDASGELYCLGRKDQQVKFRGYRIELDEISNKIVSIPEIKDALVDMKSIGDEQHLVAYVIPKQIHNESELDSWKQKWDSVYDEGQRKIDDQDGKVGDLDYVIAQVLGSDVNLEKEAEEWKRQSIQRLRSLGAKKVIEVGSGAGQIALELAPTVDSYIATDYAVTAIDNLKKKIESREDLKGRLYAEVSPAHNFTFASEASVDLVIIHSVAQYFPSFTYLTDTIKNSLKTLEEGGCLFIGDMQSASTLEMYHAFDQLRNSKPSMSMDSFKEVVSRRVMVEDELTADPSFFYHLKDIFPEISAVDIQLREGTLLNETTKYHYDIWIYKGGGKQNQSVELTLDWTSFPQESDTLGRFLKERKGKTILVRNLPNERTLQDFNFYKFLKQSGNNSLVGDFKGITFEPVSEHLTLEGYWSVAKENGFRAHIRFQNDGTDNLLEICLIPESSTFEKVLPPVPAAISYGNYSVREPFKNQMVIDFQQVRKSLAESLPSFMIPSHFILMDSFPLSQNGKVIKQKLPLPEASSSEETLVHEEDMSTLEQGIADIWKEALAISKVKLNDNFFELGGHSLLAVKVMSKIDEKLGVKISISTLFHYPTIASLASKIAESSPADAWSCIVPIKTTGQRRPLYIVHGAGLNVLFFYNLKNYLHPDQPIYGIQAKGLNGTDEPLDSIESMADYYVQELLKFHPHGDIEIAGYSFGGVVAFEMARVLKDVHGIDIPRVIMIEAYADQSSEFPNAFSKLRAKATIFLKKRCFNFKLLLKNPNLYKEHKLHYYILNIEKLYNSFIDNRGESEIDPLIMRFKYIEKTLLQALRNHKITPMDINVTLLKSKDQYHWLPDFETFGWGEFASQVKVAMIQGDHQKVFESDNIDVMAKSLELAITDKR
ncbi:non-ribosomal peptide synthetase [Belliella kenyensis]|uniref:Non-ribosomal peptide synthetase n=1 Tax=Belliella kenyensis TaxID=1472724 RepID=A0ABV8EP34_9BACT|nr:non-ribosomal peptide synthetase [Belliella kenyensis]MCH7403664.1 amino acid adenylation domain-containing protein [Belliella kenyensis]MDN3602182.1 amino acid adenylation domain-containing protein [Belliella kenyensis]